MLTTSSAIATHGDAQGAHPVMVAIHGSMVHSTLSKMSNPFFMNRYHSIGSLSQAFGWPYVGFGWKAILVQDSSPFDLDPCDNLD